MTPKQAKVLDQNWTKFKVKHHAKGEYFLLVHVPPNELLSLYKRWARPYIQIL